MSADTLIQDLQELARAKFEESASCATTANAFLHCLKLVGHHLPNISIKTDKAANQPAEVSPRAPASASKAASKPGPLRSRIADAIADIFRERGGAEITPIEIATELTKRGIPFVERMIQDYLTRGVRSGDFRRCGGGYEAVKIQEARR